MEKGLRALIAFLMVFCGVFATSAGEDNPFAKGVDVNGENPFLSREGAVKNALSSDDAVIKMEVKTIDKDVLFETDQVISKFERWVVKPGVTLRFAPQAGIRCHGILEAVGTGEKPIRFTARDEAKGWANICLLDRTANGSVFVHCRFSYGRGRNVRFINDGSFVELVAPDVKTEFTHVSGGALFVSMVANFRIESCRFDGNSAFAGGAIFFSSSSGSLESNLFVNNAASGGGAIHCVNSSPSVKWCHFSNNHGRVGGAIEGQHLSALVLKENYFSGNSADHSGGAMAFAGSDYFSGNSADHSGGAMAFAGSGTPKFVGNYVAENKAKMFGGAAYAAKGTTIHFEGNYLGDNEDAQGRGPGVYANPDESEGRVHGPSKCIVDAPATKEEVLKNLEKQGVLSLPEKLK